MYHEQKSELIVWRRQAGKPHRASSSLASSHDPQPIGEEYVQKVVFRDSSAETKRAAHEQAHQQHHPAHLHRSSPPSPIASTMSTSAPARCVTRTCQLAARSQTRSLSSQCLRIASQSSNTRSQSVQRRWQSTEAAASTNPKIATIVDQISQLTLLETADLVASLKV